MGRINLRSLIDEVLEMVKHKQNEDKRLRSDQELARLNQSWDDSPAGQAYWKDIRGRNTQMEVGRMQNAGQMDLARENNAGQMARQALMEDTKRADDVRNYNLDLYKTQIGENIGRFGAQTERFKAQTAQDTLDFAKRQQQMSAASAILEDTESTPGERKIARSFLMGSFGQQPGVLPPQPGQPAPGITPPDATKKGDYFTKDAPAQPGASSMEFASDEVLRKRKLAERNKKVEEDMFGKPKKSSFLSW